MKRQHNNKKELTEVQTLKEENKTLRAENRNLKKRIKRLERREHYTEMTSYDDPEDKQLPLFEEQKQKCPECNKGTIVHYNVVGRTWSECDQCDYRTKTIKIGLDK